MNISHGPTGYWTTFIESREQGYGAYQLHSEAFGKTALVGQTTYWDATGGFTFVTFDGKDVPVEVVEAAIAEARREIKVR